MTASAAELALIDRWQRGFPLEPRPYATVGHSVGLDEATTITTFERLIGNGIMTRIGAIVRPNAVGASTLAAMCVPRARLETVAAQVNAEPLVNHNYEREHTLNLWFVIAGPDQDAVTQTIDRIQRTTGLGVLALPLVKAYHLDTGFPLTGPITRQAAPAVACADYHPSADDRRMLAAIEDGLPLTTHPYRAVGDALDCDEGEVIARLHTLAATGIVTRLGCILRHRALGYAANAMAVWDVPDAMVDATAARMIRNPRVTLCYRRRRRPPDWPYNLFCMVHARTRPEARAILDEVNAAAESSEYAHAVLFSRRCFKQRGAVFSRADAPRARLG